MAIALPRQRSPRTPPTALRQWYEEELRWPTDGGEPLQLLTGVRFDALDLPAGAGRAVLRRVRHTGPVALVADAGDGWCGGARMLMLVAAGSAEELPGLLQWLEWDALDLDLRVRGSGERMPAPPPPPWSPGSREAAGWVRPPEPEREVETALPTTGIGAGPRGDGNAPDLVRLVSAAATECHRARLLGVGNAQTERVNRPQPLAFSNASRISAGTRPRSLTL